MVSAVSNPVNQQIPAANTFKPGSNPPEDVLQNKDKFDDSPKTRVEDLEYRNAARQEDLKESRREELYTAGGEKTDSSTRGSSLDISV